MLPLNPQLFNAFNAFNGLKQIAVNLEWHSLSNLTRKKRGNTTPIQNAEGCNKTCPSLNKHKYGFIQTYNQLSRETDIECEYIDREH